MLHKTKDSDLLDFLELLISFNDVLIVLKYPSDFFKDVYDFILNFKKDKNNQIKIKIHITGITEIDMMFRNNTEINSIKIDQPVKKIIGKKNNGAFEGCTSLKKVSIASSVTCIGDLCFKGCTSLSKVSIEYNQNVSDSIHTIRYYHNDSIEYHQNVSIGYMAFYGCISLAQIAIPDSVSIIEPFAFYGCTSLKQITIPESVTFIGEKAFGKN